MIINPPTLQTFLRICAAAQLAVALLNLALNRMMGWRGDLDRMPLLLRQVHQVHAWFISVTLAGFAVLTWHFAPELAVGTSPIGRWLSAFIGIFWAFRTILQLGYYSRSDWRGRKDRTLIHITLLLLYGGFALTYLSAASGAVK